MSGVRAEQKPQVLAVFDAAAGTWQAGYDQTETFRNYNFLVRRQRVLELLGTGLDACLDLGCGTGDYIPGLLQQSRQVWAVDAAPEMVARVKARFGATAPSLQIAQGDVERLQFPDASFEAVVCVGVLEYLDDDRSALAEIARVLKPNGVAVLTVPNRASGFLALDRAIIEARRCGGLLLERLGLFERLMGRPRRPRCRSTCYVPWRFNASLARMGLTVVETRYCSFGSVLLGQCWPAMVVLSRWAERFHRHRLAALLGVNYIVKVAKRERRG